MHLSRRRLFSSKGGSGLRGAAWRTALECDSHGSMSQQPTRPPDAHEQGTPRLAFVVLGLAFLMMALARGASETFTVFLLPISNTFGWDRAQAVSVYSIGALCVGLAGPFVGRLFDHSGPRAVYAAGLFLIGAGFSAAAFAQKIWQFTLYLCLATGLVR